MSDASKNLYEAILQQLSAAASGGAPSPALPPARASAAVVLWRRREEGGIEVFWIQRAEALPFMGGWHAFPGGALSRSDAAVPVAGSPVGVGVAKEPAAGLPESLRDDLAGPDLPPGILACAVRELFEETGLLLATPAMSATSGTARAPQEPAGLTEDWAEARRALLAGERPFAELLAGLGRTADASRLVWAGRWMTPPFAPLRFDNRFFLLEWPRQEAVQPTVLPGECAAGEWIEPGAAWQRWHRGEVLAAPPILHILEVLAENGPAAHGLERLRDPAETNLGPLRRVEMRPGVVMFPLLTHTLPPAATTNTYLVGHGDAVLVDPGSSLEVENDRLERALAAAADQLGRRVTAIWLTHHHPDHVGGVERLRAALGVPVLAHPRTAERLAGRIRIDGELEDGQRVTLAGDPPCTVRIVHTPGHARGHLCFFVEEDGSLLAGDLVAGIGMIVIDPPEGDMEDYLASLQKLLDLAPGGPRTLFPAHGPVVKDGAGKLREYIEHRLWREERILAAWNAGLRQPREMLATVYDDVPKEAHGLAERQILAHLERLRRRGRLPGE